MKNAGVINPAYITIGSEEIITRRDIVAVKCYPDTVVNDYVPFYFSVRTPMLYNIITGKGVSAQPEEEIIYLCYKLTDLATADFVWCFTDGNAAKVITRFFNDLKDLDKLDWHSINTHDFRDNNSDGDEDRVRKKHAEFLVKKFVPVEFLRIIVVKTLAAKQQVEAILNLLDFTIVTQVDSKFYF